MTLKEDNLSDAFLELESVMAEANLLLQQQREMLESNISDLNQRRDVEKIDKLKKETARLHLAVKRSKEADRRRRELGQRRKRVGR